VTSLLGIGLLSGCVTPDIGGPVAPRWDENAGLLTLSSGRTVAVYPADLAYSGDALYRWPDGREYDGSWRNGKPDGMGQETRPDGERRPLAFTTATGLTIYRTAKGNISATTAPAIAASGATAFATAAASTTMARATATTATGQPTARTVSA
jgi:hypothetical protein